MPLFENKLKQSKNDANENETRFTRASKISAGCMMMWTPIKSRSITTLATSKRLDK
jgi:hypothetical protein